MENYTKEDLFNLSLDNKVKLINYVMLFTDSDYICANGAALDTNNIKWENFSDKSDFLPFGFSHRSDNSSFNIKANCFMWTDLIDDHDLSKFLLPEQVNKFLEIADNGWSDATAEIESDSEIFKLSQDQCNKLCNILLDNFNDSQNKIKSVLSDGYNVLKDSYTPSIFERQLKSIQSYNQELTGADLNHYITENFHFITPEQQIFTECPMPGKKYVEDLPPDAYSLSFACSTTEDGNVDFDKPIEMSVNFNDPSYIFDHAEQFNLEILPDTHYLEKELLTNGHVFNINQPVILVNFDAESAYFEDNEIYLDFLAGTLCDSDFSSFLSIKTTDFLKKDDLEDFLRSNLKETLKQNFNLNDYSQRIPANFLDRRFPDTPGIDSRYQLHNLTNYDKCCRELFENKNIDISQSDSQSHESLLTPLYGEEFVKSLENQTSGDSESIDESYVNPVSDPKSVYFEGAKYNTDFIQYNGEYIDDYGVWKVPLSELNSVREPSMLDKICYRSLDDVEACSRMSKNELFKLIIDQAKQNTQSQTQDCSFHL